MNRKIIIGLIGICLLGLAFLFFGSEVSEKNEISKPSLEKNSPPKLASLSSGFGCGIHSVAFFWQFSDIDKNDFQTAFQIQIDNEEDFTSPLFDSQKTETFSEIEANYFRYDLPEKLPEAEQYFWRLKIWDNQNNASDWSRRQILPI